MRGASPKFSVQRPKSWARAIAVGYSQNGRLIRMTTIVHSRERWSGRESGAYKNYESYDNSANLSLEFPPSKLVRGELGFGWDSKGSQDLQCEFEHEHIRPVDHERIQTFAYSTCQH